MIPSAPIRRVHGSIHWVLAVGACLTARAQLPTSDLRTISPPAARVGETIEARINGTNLDDLRELRFTHPGITAKQRMLPKSEFLGRALPDVGKFDLTIASNVPPGVYEVRAAGYFGLSTGRPFVVVPSDSVEVKETGKNFERETAMPIEIGTVVSGTTASRGIDWYRFTADAGERLMVQCFAERIDSKVDGMLVLYNANGRELDRNRQQFGRDPCLDVLVEEGGDYYLALSDILFRGSSGDYFYRLQVTRKPHIDFIWPPMGEAGKKSQFRIYGRNLPGGTLSDGLKIDGKPLEHVDVSIEMPTEEITPMRFHPGQPRQGMMRGYDYRHAGSEPWRIGFASAAVLFEKREVEVQSIQVPVEIAGRFDRGNETDRYRFQAKKGVTYWIESVADRMAADIDAAVVVRRVDKGIKEIAEFDDPVSYFSKDGLDAINFDTSDAFGSFTPAEDGEFEVEIRNQFGSAGTALIYRLAIREAAHDFDLIASTERPLPTNRTGYSVTPLLRRNARWAIRMIVPRRDGFEGEIVVTATGLPEGVRANPLRLHGTTDTGMLVLAADDKAKDWAGEIDIVGRATINGKRVTRTARFSSLIWGHIFSDSIRVRSRLAERVPLGVNEHEQAVVVIKSSKRKYTVEEGAKLEIPITITEDGTRTGNLTISPDGLFGLHRSPPTVNIAQGKTEGTLSIDFKNRSSHEVKPGTYQFTLQGVGVSKYRANVPAANRLGADRRAIRKIVEDLTAKVDEAKSALASAEQTYKQAKQSAETATADDKASVAKRAESAKDALDSARASEKELSDKLSRARKEQAMVDKLAKAAAAKAVSKNTKFAAWSDPISVTVTRKAK